MGGGFTYYMVYKLLSLNLLKTYILTIQILVFAHCWARGYKLIDAMHKSEIKSSKTAVDWTSFCREILLADFVDNFQPLGGEGRTVEIDESKFGKRKFWRG